MTGEIAFVDLDGTLIDQNYNITDDRIYDSIDMAQQQGWTIGLSSDTPFEALEVWRGRFGMNGSIIAERGAVVEIDGTIEADPAVIEAFTIARLGIESALRDSGVCVWSGNPVEEMRKGLRVGEIGETVLLMNNLRLCGLSFFARKVDQSGSLIIDDATTELIAEQASVFYPDFDDLVEEINPDYGIIIASRSDTTKRSGTLQMMQKTGIGKVAMIGNSLPDFVGSDIALHYAVGDASASFKERADYIALSPITSGVVEILNRLVTISNQ